MQVTEFFCSPIAVIWSALLQKYSWWMAVQWGGRARPLRLWPHGTHHWTLSIYNMEPGRLSCTGCSCWLITLQANNWITGDTLVDMEIEISEGRTPQRFTKTYPQKLINTERLKDLNIVRNKLLPWIQRNVITSIQRWNWILSKCP